MDERDECRKCRLHRERLERLRRRYRFDDRAADRAVAFFERNLRHWKAPFAGKPFLLTEWQKEMLIRPLFGFMRDDGSRLFRRTYVQMARKNGKSAIAAGILLLILCTDGEGLELYTAATTKDQAKIVFADCQRFARASPELRKRLRILTHSIEYPSRNSRLVPVSSEYENLDGLNVAAASVDEIHAHPNRSLYEVILTATGTRRQPLVFGITTAGDREPSLCKELYDEAEAILEGQIEDDSIFCLIAEADKGLAWDDPRAYRQANPNLGVTVQEDYIRERLLEAKNRPTARRSYERYTLNRWVAGSADTWLSLEKWKANRREFTWADLVGRKCYGGLDLASTTDLSAFALLFPMGGAEIRVCCWFWIPEESLVARVEKDRVPYDVWRDAGWIRTTAGNVADYEVIARDILELKAKYRIVEIAFDEWNAVPVWTALQKKGMKLYPFIQGLKSFHTPSTEFEKAILAGTLLNDGNPVLSWNVGNVLARVDASEKLRPVKEYKSSTKRVDGVIASIMALDALIRREWHKKKSMSEAMAEIEAAGGRGAMGM